jgi:carboxyvinyl-carboxyphosphonate phosphorylmutase
MLWCSIGASQWTTHQETEAMKTTTKLRQLLRSPGIIVAPGAYDCLTAKLIEGEGFPAVYMTGAGTALTRLGKPDLGFATLSEMVANAAVIASTISIPLIADADTGYGGALNVYRTVREYEKAGVAALHIEDQVFPKRCGHLDGKQVVPVEDMATKLRAAVEARTDDDFVVIARTDALAVTGLDDTLRRCHAYIEAGADVLFVEALRTREEIERIVREVSVPLLYNFVEHGKSPLLPVDELQRLGFKMVIFPGSIMLAVVPLVRQILGEINRCGTTDRLLDRMTNVVELFETMGLSDLLALDARVSGTAAATSPMDARS